MVDMSLYAKQLTMWREQTRLASFTEWVFEDDAKCNSAALAEAGFYYVGNPDEPDAVQCFFCSKTLDGWEEDDDPWYEHVKHANNCSFVKIHLPERSMTVQQFLDIRKEQVQRLMRKAVDDANKHDEEVLMDIIKIVENCSK